jgi:hypothetical protein
MILYRKKRQIVKWFWQKHRDFLLDKKGFFNNTIHQDTGFLTLFFEIYSENRANIRIREMYNIYKLVQQAQRIDGEMAEVGVYKGGSARIICAKKRDKGLHLFDTFAGMPEVNSQIDQHKKGDFADTSLENVKKYLGKFNRVYYYPGLFPDTGQKLAKSMVKFCFVNLDVDLYESTLNSLKFFYPKMNQGGFILSHDYLTISCPGVTKAYDEFFIDKPEPIIELWDSQCLIIKA